MKTKAFRDVLTKAPFEPFTVKLSNGDTLDVIHRDYAFIAPAGDVVIIYSADHHHKRVDMDHIVTLTPVRPRKRPRGTTNK